MDGNCMRAVPSPSASASASNLPTFFRWCLGGMAGSASASARDANADASSLERYRKHMDAQCGHFSTKQLDLIARAHFIGGHRGGVDEEEEEEEAEVFSTPPLTQQDPQRPGQRQRGQAGDGEDVITMCSMPFTQTPPSSPAPAPASSPSSDSWERKAQKPRKPRICTRKVRRGAKLRTPTPEPSPRPSPSPSPSLEIDPLVRIVQMIPTAPLGTTGDEDILELARSRGIF